MRGETFVLLHLLVRIPYGAHTGNLGAISESLLIWMKVPQRALGLGYPTSCPQIHPGHGLEMRTKLPLAPRSHRAHQSRQEWRGGADTSGVCGRMSGRRRTGRLVALVRRPSTLWRHICVFLSWAPKTLAAARPCRRNASGGSGGTRGWDEAAPPAELLCPCSVSSRLTLTSWIWRPWHLTSPWTERTSSLAPSALRRASCRRPPSRPPSTASAPCQTSSSHWLRWPLTAPSSWTSISSSWKARRRSLSSGVCPSPSLMVGARCPCCSAVARPTPLSPPWEAYPTPSGPLTHHYSWGPWSGPVKTSTQRPWGQRPWGPPPPHPISPCSRRGQWRRHWAASAKAVLYGGGGTDRCPLGAGMGLQKAPGPIPSFHPTEVRYAA